MNKKNKEMGSIHACFRALRPHHIVKNFLLFIPLLVGHHYFDPVSLKNSFVGFLVFCLLASSAYLINDLVDLERDRQHSKKCKRPFAAGELPLAVGYVLAPFLLLFALIVALYLPLNFFLAASAYYALTLLYSFCIKKIKWLDVALLAILYSLRVFAGMTLVENGYSLWLIIFVLFFFFSLALLKRYAEIYAVKLASHDKLIGRAYGLIDGKKLSFLGNSSAYLAVLTFVFYVNSNKVYLLYKHPLFLWLICPCLLIWLKRLWSLAQQGKLHADPVVFTVLDKFSWLMLALIIFIDFFAL